MSDNSTANGEWWASISAYESDYVPDSFSTGSYVKANHNLFLGIRENHFSTTNSDYTYGLLAFVVFFLAAGILAIYLLPVLYLYVIESYGECFAQRVKIGQQSFWKGNLLLLVTTIVTIAIVPGTVWGLTKADVGLTTIEDNAQDIASDFRVVLDLPVDTYNALENFSTAYDALRNVTCKGNTSFFLSPINITFVDGVRTEIESLSTDALDDLAGKVEGVSEAVKTTKDIRKGLVWPLIYFAIVMVICLLMARGISSIFACKANNKFAKLITPCSSFLALILWVSAAAAISISAVTGDICIHPNTNVEVLLRDANDTNLTDIARYYTGNCSTNNVIVDGIIAAQDILVLDMNSTMPALYGLVEICSELSPYVQDMDNAMYDLWSVLEDAGELSSCENVNVPYQEAVYDQLCTNLPEGLLGFWVSCVILAVLLPLLAVQWNKVLHARSTVAPATSIEVEQQQLGIIAIWWSKRSSSKRRVHPREEV